MPSLKAFLLLSTALLIIFAQAAYAHSHDDDYECNHHEQEDVEPMDVQEDFSTLTEGGRLLANTTYPNFRIKTNFDNIQSASSSFRNYVQYDLVPPIIDWFQGALRIKYPTTSLLTRTTTTVCSVTTPSDLRKGVAADFYYILRYKTVDSTNVMTSGHCATASGSRRPTVGHSTINTVAIKPANGDVVVFERHLYVLIHELMHIFGWSDGLFSNFLDENGNRRTGHVKSVTLNGNTRKVLDIPFLTQKARAYFGCSTLPGIYLEDDGGSGTANSHLDKKFFLWSAITSGGYYGKRVSEISLGLLEATGWFAPNYDFAEPFHYGQGQGCGFFTETCSSTTPKFDEFCVGSSRRCTNVGRSGGSCSSDDLADGCKYYRPSLNYDCINPNAEDYARLPTLQAFGPEAGSKCFTGTLNTRSGSSRTSFCFRYTCVGSGTDTQLQVQVGKSTITCQQKGTMTVSGYYGVVDCPDPLTFCNTVGKEFCPFNCLGRGTCVNNKCQCNDGYTGYNCAQKI